MISNFQFIYQMTEDSKIYGSYAENKRMAENKREDWKMLGLQ